MKTYPPITTNITGNKFNCLDFYNMNFKFRNSHRFLLVGYVKKSDGIALKNAGVEVIKRDRVTGNETPMGIVFTDIDGKYAVSLEVTARYDYIFNIYSPI